MRKLATIARIENLEPIPNADRILKATVRGWECVVAKSDNFNVGDKVIFVEVDSILPPRPEFAFMKDRKYRVRTIKLRKQISQGLVLPVSYLRGSYHEIGDDVTKELGITKYDPQAEAETKLIKQSVSYPRFLRFLMKYRWFRKLLAKFSVSNASFPTDICAKTDEERCLWGRTKIDTDKGKVPLVDIVNDKDKYKILTYNEKDKIFEYKPIEKVQKLKCNEPLLEIKFNNSYNYNRQNSITCTRDHPFYTNDGYKNAEDLKVGDLIYDYVNCYSKDLYPILYGMALGDASFKKDKRLSKNLTFSDNITIGFTQGENQLEYLKFKLSLFGNDNCKVYEGKSGYCNNKVYSSYIKSDFLISKHFNEIMFDGKNKIITKEFCNLLTPVSLAIWYMDDGTIRYKDSKPQVRICSCAYSYDENSLLVECLNKRFGIDCHVVKDKQFYSIYITVQGTEKFLQLIAPYVHPSMRYKLPDNLQNVEFALNGKKFYKELQLNSKQVNAINISKRKICTVYDLTVADNHNFFANGVLTHNCQNLVNKLKEWRERKIIFYVTEKLDGCSATYFLDNKTFGVCSRNVWLRKEDDSPYWEVARRFGLKDCLKDIAKTYNANKVVIQGEIIGKSIQGNKYHVSGYDFFVYNVIIDDLRIEQDKASFICKKLGLNNVPVLTNDFMLPPTIHDIVEKARGKSLLYDIDREGIVVRNYREDISFKVINPDFLLKNNE